MWVTMGTIAAIAICIGIYLAVGSVRAGATWREVMPPVALLTFGIAFAGLLLVLEGKLFPILVYNVAGVDHYISMGLPSIVSIAVCIGIAKVWGRMFGAPANQDKATPE
jgi:hypothetical protein